MEEEEEEIKRFIIGKITSNPFIPKKEHKYDDSNYEGGFNIVRKVEWKEFDQEIPKGFKDYVGRNRQTFVLARNSMLNFSDVAKIYEGQKFDEYEKINNSYEDLVTSIQEYLSSMDAFEFEKYIYYLLNEVGWDVILTPRSGDKGIDLFGTANILGNYNVEVVIQLKTYKESVGKRFI